MIWLVHIPFARALPIITAPAPPEHYHRDRGRRHRTVVDRARRPASLPSPAGRTGGAPGLKDAETVVARQAVFHEAGRLSHTVLPIAASGLGDE